MLSETGDGDARRWDARYGTHYIVQQSGTGAAESVTLKHTRNQLLAMAVTATVAVPCTVAVTAQGTGR